MRKILTTFSVNRVLFLFFLIILACNTGSNNNGPSPGDNTSDPPQGKRDKLTAANLLNDPFTQVIHYDYFLPVGETEPPGQQLSGTLSFTETRLSTSHPDAYGWGGGHQYFPAFSLPVISHKGHLIPLKRGLILSGGKLKSFWNIIVSPGRVWQEPGDNGFCRASFPFTFTDNYIGQARNGVATFVFNAAEISPAAIQIAQETAPVDDYITANFVGKIPIVYEAEEFIDRNKHIQDYQHELAVRLPVKAWSILTNSDSTKREFNAGLTLVEVSAAAMLMDGTLYFQQVETRAGPYPYPEVMRHGVFSVTKTLAMGLAMFYFAEKYGEGLFDELITDWVPALAGHTGWAGVTFEHTFGMATGTAGGDKGSNIIDFIRARSAGGKIAAIENLPDASHEPGEQFNYASTNTFVLSYALSRYVKAKEGDAADYWLIVTENVLKPMGIRCLPLSRTIEDNGELGTPVMGWGSYPNIHEAAKIGQLLQDEGVFQGIRLLNGNKVRQALNRTSRQGYYAGNGQYYLHSLWLFPVATRECQIYVPNMQGHGGNFVMILPSGLVAIRFTDCNSYDISPMVNAVENYRSSCLTAKWIMNHGIWAQRKDGTMKEIRAAAYSRGVKF